MDTNFLFAQLFGALGLVASVCSMQFKKRRQIFLALLFLNLFAALNFVFLKSWTTVYISLFAIFELIVNNLFEWKKRPVPSVVVAFYVVANIALGLLGFATWLDVLPIICSLIFCATILMKREQNIRRATLANQFCWLIFDLASGAYFFALSNVLTLISTVLALLRYHKNTKSRKSVPAASKKKKAKKCYNLR